MSSTADALALTSGSISIAISLFLVALFFLLGSQVRTALPSGEHQPCAALANCAIAGTHTRDGQPRNLPFGAALMACNWALFLLDLTAAPIQLRSCIMLAVVGPAAAFALAMCALTDARPSVCYVHAVCRIPALRQGAASWRAAPARVLVDPFVDSGGAPHGRRGHRARVGGRARRRTRSAAVSRLSRGARACQCQHVTINELSRRWLRTASEPRSASATDAGGSVRLAPRRLAFASQQGLSVYRSNEERVRDSIATACGRAPSHGLGDGRLYCHCHHRRRNAERLACALSATPH
jgi:hypothetical protein